MDKVLIRGLEVSACHGVHDFEKTAPQKFIFDVDIACDFCAAAQGDDLTKTVNYSAACNLIAETAKSNSFNLIEKLAYECAFSLMDANKNAESVKITVYKPEAPVRHDFKTVGVEAEVCRERAYLSLGSSEGDRKKYLDTALAMLAKTRGIEVKKVSKYIETAPYGGVAKNEFLNCAAEIQTYLSPRALLGEIHRIEAACGRVRTAHWSDRTLDIDIIFFGRKIIAEEGLTIPHPEYSRRDFVLIPLKEIAPEFVCPLTFRKMTEI